MITLYREAQSAEADVVEETLQDLVFAHAVEVVDGPGEALPRIADGDRVVHGADLPAYLDELRRLKADWSRFQSDACFIGDDGVCL